MSRKPHQAVALLTAVALAATLSGCGGARKTAPDQKMTGGREIMPADGGSYLPEPQLAPASGMPLLDPNKPVSNVADPNPGPPPIQGSAPSTGSGSPGSQPPAPPPSAEKAPEPTPQSPATNMPEIVAFRSLERGSNSGVETQSVVLIRSQADWTAKYSRPLPQVDFGKESVIGVFIGQKNTGGYGVTVRQVVVQGNVITVHAQSTSPSPGSMVTMAITTPFHLVSIPRVGMDATVQVLWH